eukprot:TRINITY_DN14964_c0_g1_i2.p1 TRINITY_DN14964_c0_g1~~TRINITY_DN14964_c0_g1_i2.p1  ORF type:complete len:732 (+),score=161.45 TRINITY_DN14964_c0_g1_i2:105-2198(+)
MPRERTPEVREVAVCRRAQAVGDEQCSAGGLIEIFTDPSKDADVHARSGGIGRPSRIHHLECTDPAAAEGAVAGVAGALNKCLMLVRHGGDKTRKVWAGLSPVAALLCRLDHLRRRRDCGGGDAELRAAQLQLNQCHAALHESRSAFSGRGPLHAAERAAAAAVRCVAEAALAAAEHAAQRAAAAESWAAASAGSVEQRPVASPDADPAALAQATTPGLLEVPPIRGLPGSPVLIVSSHDEEESGSRGGPHSEGSHSVSGEAAVKAAVAESSALADKADAVLVTADALFYGAATGGRRELTSAFELYHSVAAEVPRAAWQTAQSLEHGWGVKEDRTEALRWYRHGASLGCQRCAAAAARLLEARGGEAEVREACVLWRQAADAGDPDAMLALGRLAEAGGALGAAPLPSLAAEWYGRAAAAGDERGEARAALAMLVLRHRSAAQAAELLHDAAGHGHGEAARTLGWLTESGALPCDDDSASSASGGSAVRCGSRLQHRLSAALRWYQRAAELGSAEASADVGYCQLVLGAFGAGIAALNAAVGGRQAEGLYCLGEAHRRGVALPRDPAAAHELFTAAAAAGHKRARVRLADTLYSDPRDVNVCAALELYCKAGAEGDAEACASAAVLLEDGAPGVDPSPRQAAMWRRRADGLRGSYCRWGADAMELVCGSAPRGCGAAPPPRASYSEARQSSPPPLP